MQQFLGLLLAGLVGATADVAPRFAASAEQVERYAFVEYTLELDNPPQGNPFIDASLSGVFTPQVGDNTAPAEPLAVEGFCDSDDGRLYRLRFMPTRVGRHDYVLTFRQGDKAFAINGSVTALPSPSRGLVQADPGHPTHFVYQGTGEHYFCNSTTTYYLLGWKDDAVIESSLKRLAGLGVNRVRVALSGRTPGGNRWKEPMVENNEQFAMRLEPWPAKDPTNIAAPGYDVSRFNLAHFRKVERMLAAARRLGIQVSLIFSLDVKDTGVDPFPADQVRNEDEQRYYRYVVSRFGAFDNVWWDLVNEWHLCRSEAWVDATGGLVDSCDPYGHLTSVHGTGNFPFGQSPWVDYVSFQSWDEHGAYEFLINARREQAQSGRPLPVINEEYGYEDHYPYPWGDKRVWPSRIAESRVRLAWEMTMAGCYQTTGERANVAGGGGWITGRGDDTMTMLAGYAGMKDFFTALPWWRLEPRPDLVEGRSDAAPVIEGQEPPATTLCLAETGERYVIYLRYGRTGRVKVAPGAYRVRLYNPRAAEYAEMERLTITDGWQFPAPPDTDPWVYLVEKADKL